jgi:biopolymer transport protein ExbD
MARFSRLRRLQEEEPDINLIPIMNMFMVLIPFLLMSASFFHIKSINTSLPVHADKPAKTEQQKELEKNKVTVVLELKESQLRISVLSDTPNDVAVSDMETTIPRQPGTELSVAALADHLKKLKARYPDSDTMILIPDDQVAYDEIIRTMDCARRSESGNLFPNVVISGSLG